MQRFNENIHHKNMKLFSQYLEAWRTSKVSSLTSEVGYMYYDLEQDRYLGSSSNLAWRGEFHEKDLDVSGTNLLNEGCFILPSNSVIKSAYNKLEYSRPESYKTIFCRKDTFGFELFGVVTAQELSGHDQGLMHTALSNLSYEVDKWTKRKASIYTPIKAYDLASEKFHSERTKSMIHYDKAKFKGNLILTTKEQEYIELLIYQYTHDQIAHMRGVSPTAVRKVILNIKRKLGFQNMPTHQMMIKLKELGVLGIYASSLMHETHQPS